MPKLDTILLGVKNFLDFVASLNHSTAIKLLLTGKILLKSFSRQERKDLKMPFLFSFPQKI